MDTTTKPKRRYCLPKGWAHMPIRVPGIPLSTEQKAVVQTLVEGHRAVFLKAISDFLNNRKKDRFGKFFNEYSPKAQEALSRQYMGITA